MCEYQKHALPSPIQAINNNIDKNWPQDAQQDFIWKAFLIWRVHGSPTFRKTLKQMPML